MHRIVATVLRRFSPARIRKTGKSRLGIHLNGLLGIFLIPPSSRNAYVKAELTM